ncbi:MAG: TIGR03943 family putative permease subunit [Gaiellaceae bacterium]
MAAVNAAGGTITMLVGVVTLRLTFTDTYRRYVQPAMGKWLLIAGVVIIVIGLVTLINALRNVEPVEGHGHDDEHSHRVGVGWLLLAPIAALLLVAPPTLGAYGVDRAGSINIRPGHAFFKPLQRSAGPAEMTLLEFIERAFEHDGASFHGAPVRLTGFVAGSEAGGFRLARYQIACCAADATPVAIDVVGTSGTPPTDDQWVTVTGTFERGGGDLPRLAATSVVEIPAPEDPFE